MYLPVRSGINVDVNVVAAVLGNDKNAKCSSKTNNHQKAWIKKHG